MECYLKHEYLIITSVFFPRRFYALGALYDVPSCAVLLRIYNRTRYKISMCKRNGSKLVSRRGKGQSAILEMDRDSRHQYLPSDFSPPATLYFSSCYSFIKNIARRKKDTCLRIGSPRRRRKYGNRVYCKWIVTLDISTFLSPSFRPTLYFPPSL